MAATTRTSLVEQKRLQWAKEREEMSRLVNGYAPVKVNDPIRTSIRTYNINASRSTLSEMNGRNRDSLPHHQLRPRYASTMSLTGSDLSTVCATSFRNLDYSSSSLVDLQDQVELERLSRKRSPSLPPIHTKNDYRYQDEDRQSSTHRCSGGHARRHRSRDKQRRCSRASGPPEEREGETSGYASDNFENNNHQHNPSTANPHYPHHLHHQQQHKQQSTVVLPCHVNCNVGDSVMGEKCWHNPYNYEDENSIQQRSGEFNRQRWGSVWGQQQDSSKDPPPPSWLERGLSRLDHSSQVLVINHDSTSSPDSSTTGSLGSDTNKTYLRGQNLPIDADILQQREEKRQRALELQKAIKQQLEDQEKKRKEERENKLREERAEEERIKKDRDLEKQRLEEEQRREREKEAMKQKKNRAMQESIEAAERRAREEKLQRQRRRQAADQSEEDHSQENIQHIKGAENDASAVENIANAQAGNVDKDAKQLINARESDSYMETHESRPNTSESIRLPINQEIAIILSGRLEDPELLNKSALKLVNLVVSPRGGKREGSSGGVSLSAILNGLSSPVVLRTSSGSVENRLLTPSKYRVSSGRDCATQTDCEDTGTDYAEKIQEIHIEEAKERKEVVNNSRRDVEKSTNTGSDEPTMKSLPRNKSQTRSSIESRPRWNANRPGTRYRTQSEKDPHYQRRMRLRRRQVETSDEGSSDFRRSPSPSRRKNGIIKAKSRSSARRKPKLSSYDADLSMEDSLNSLVPLHTDKNGIISIDRRGSARDDWSGEDILSHLSSLRNGLIMKKKEWDLQACPVSPITELY